MDRFGLGIKNADDPVFHTESSAFFLLHLVHDDWLHTWFPYAKSPFSLKYSKQVFRALFRGDTPTCSSLVLKVYLQPELTLTSALFVSNKRPVKNPVFEWKQDMEH